MMVGYLREVEKKHKLAGNLCNIKDMGEGVKQHEYSENHMVRREVCRIQQLQDQVARLQADFSKSGKKDKVNERTGKSCQTCPQGSRHEGKPCLGKKAKECYGCKEAGHFKGAPICKAKERKKEKLKYKKVRQLKELS